MKLTAALLVYVPATVFGKKDLSAFKRYAGSDTVRATADEALASMPHPRSSLGESPEGFNADVVKFSSSKVTDRINEDRRLRGTGGSKSGSGSHSASSSCNFIAHAYDPYNGAAFIEINNGVISAFQSVVTDDDDYISICDGTKCVGDGTELTFVASGSCGGSDAYLQFSLYTSDNFDGGTASSGYADLHFACPEATMEASAECRAFDGTQELLNDDFPTINYDTDGPIVYIEFDDSENYLYGCTVTCDGQDIDLFP